MQKTLIAALLSLATAAGFAATANDPAAASPDATGVVKSTDPAKAADVERHAQEIKAEQHEDMDTTAKTMPKKVHHAKAHHKAASGAAAASGAM